MTGRLGIDDVTPTVGDGHHPSKAVVGEVIPIGATVWREGHDAIAANVVWKKVGSDGPGQHVRMAPHARRRRPLHRDGRAGRAGPVDVPGRRLERPVGDLATRRHRQARRRAGPGRAGERPRGRRPAAAARGPPAAPSAPTATCCSPRRTRCATPRCRCTRPRRARALPGRADDHGRAPGPRADHPRPAAPGLRRPHPRAVRLLVRVLPAVHRRPRRERPARCTARSPPSAKELDRVAAMGFDVVYLPPIHPIGTVHRKGPNSAALPGGNPVAQPGDVGSPWAIGSAEGGHDAIHPELGDFDDFDAFVARAKDLGMEVALDFALQAAPDHPWVRRAPRVVHRAPRRLDRLRGEPAEEVPGHLPDQLRQRPRRASTPSRCAA